MPSAQKEKIKTESEHGFKVCFVCTGNTCRSPMAAAVYNHLNKGSGKIAISAGIGADGFSPISENAVSALHEKGIQSTEDNDYEKHISTQVSEEMLSCCNCIYGITEKHTMALICAFPQFANRISPLPLSITDPYGGDLSVYRSCLDLIIKAVGELS